MYISSLQTIQLSTITISDDFQLKLFNSSPHHQILKTLTKKPFENIMGKGENAGN